MKDLCSKSKYLKTLYNIYKVIIIIFVSSFVLLEGLILLNISETKDVDKVDNIDTMIVLGAKVNGTEVSNTLKLRLDEAIEYYNKHKSVNIIVSGGQGNYENITVNARNIHISTSHISIFTGYSSFNHSYVCFSNVFF